MHAEERPGNLKNRTFSGWFRVAFDPRETRDRHAKNTRGGQNGEILIIETVFLYPWAVVVKQLGIAALVSVAFFLLVLIFGLAYAWRKGVLEWK